MPDALGDTAMEHAEFVDHCYRRFLGRPADPGGQAGYVQALERGLSRLDCIAALVTSPEYHARLTALLAGRAEAEGRRAVEAERLRGEIAAGRERALRWPLPATPASTTGDDQDGLAWFFALNEEAWGFADYARMAQAAVRSAQRHTRLRPHLLYDGPANELTCWMERQGVTVLSCRTGFYDELADHARRLGNRDVLGVGAGTFLRVELPALWRQGVIRDEVILYTDCDVLFLDDLAGLPRPDGLVEPMAAAPEENIEDYVHINAGVMLMNLPALAASDAEFQAYCRTHMADLLQRSREQTAYQEFYAGQWRRLDPAYNWKPYWGADPARAKLVHFHGPKPTQLGLVERQEHPPFIQDLARGGFFELAAVWERYDQPADGE